MIHALMLALAAIQTPVHVISPAPAVTATQVETLFILTYQQGPSWIAGEPMHRQRLADHFRYMLKLTGEGALVGGGPFTGENAGMAIIRAPDLAAARAILAADPAITTGVFTGSARAWEVRVGAMRTPGR